MSTGIIFLFWFLHRYGFTTEVIVVNIWTNLNYNFFTVDFVTVGELHSIILYVGCFTTPRFGLLSVQSLLYMPISLIFTLNYLCTVCHRVLSRAQCANEGGGGIAWVA